MILCIWHNNSMHKTGSPISNAIFVIEIFICMLFLCLTWALNSILSNFKWNELEQYLLSSIRHPVISDLKTFMPCIQKSRFLLTLIASNCGVCVYIYTFVRHFSLVLYYSAWPRKLVFPCKVLQVTKIMCIQMFWFPFGAGLCTEGVTRPYVSV